MFLKVDLEIRKREFELVFKDMELEEEVKKKGYYYQFFLIISSCFLVLILWICIFNVFLIFVYKYLQEEEKFKVKNFKQFLKDLMKKKKV